MICGTFDSVKIRSANVFQKLICDRINDLIYFGYFRKYLLGLESDFPSASGKLAADINNDSSINSIDFANLRLILLGKT